MQLQLQLQFNKIKEKNKIFFQNNFAVKVNILNNKCPCIARVYIFKDVNLTLETVTIRVRNIYVQQDGRHPSVASNKIVRLVLTQYDLVKQ